MDYFDKSLKIIKSHITKEKDKDIFFIITIDGIKLYKEFTSLDQLCNFLLPKITFAESTIKIKYVYGTSNNNYAYFYFTLSAFYSNCGAVIINSIYSCPLIKKIRVFHMAIDMAKKLGYGIAMYSHYDIHTLNTAKRLGMKKIHEFINPRSAHRLEILSINL